MTMLLLWDRLIPQVKVSLGKYLRTQTLRLSYLKLHIMQPEWHARPGPSRPIQEFPAHPGSKIFRPGPAGPIFVPGPRRVGPGRRIWTFVSLCMQL